MPCGGAVATMAMSLWWSWLHLTSISIRLLDKPTSMQGPYLKALSLKPETKVRGSSRPVNIKKSKAYDRASAPRRTDARHHHSALIDKLSKTAGTTQGSLVQTNCQDPREPETRKKWITKLI